MSNPDKAYKVLGRNDSRQKVKKQLGLEDEDFYQVESELMERQEEECRKSREMETAKDRKNSLKALDRLGYEPSKIKVMNTLGIDEAEVLEAEQENVEREEQLIARKRKNSGSVDKKHSLKALDVLGHDPSKEKVMSTLGINEIEVSQAEQDNVDMYEAKMEKIRSSSLIEKRKSVKALKVLGFDPSKNKLIDTLGLAEDEFQIAESEEYEKYEESVKRKRDAINNKKNMQKALTRLGHDPLSEKKLENKFGVDKDTINSAMSKSQRVTNSLHATDTIRKLSVSGALIAVLGALFLYWNSNIHSLIQRYKQYINSKFHLVFANGGTKVKSMIGIA